MQESLKSKTISGILWSSIERFSLGIVQFTLNLLMARLLLPSDYGMIGMLAIFLQISQAFVDAGFTNALIQRCDRTEEDFSMVFYFNVVISIVFYALLFLSAPWIAHFYDMPQLIIVTRIIALSLIINSLSAVHKTILTIKVDFKTQSKISLLAALFSGGIGLWMAYSGYGVWALVGQTLLNSLILTVLFYYIVAWKPLMFFSMESFYKLYSFASKFFLSGMINTVYSNLYTFVVGKRFSAVDLGYYTCASQIVLFPSANLNAIIMRVMYPVLCNIQDEDERLKYIYRMYVRLASYMIFPLMVGLAVLAQPIIELSLTEKWSNVIILLQILCIGYMFDHLGVININLLYVKGRSDLSLRLEIIKKVILTIILISSIPFGLVGICYGRVLYSLIAVFFNSIYTKCLIGLSLLDQLNDILPSLFLSILMGVIMYIATLYSSNIIKLIVGVIIGICFYGLFSFLFKIDSYRILLNLIIQIKRLRR